MPELNGDEAEKMETVTKVVERLYQDNFGDHHAVIAQHDRITREYDLTNEQWNGALRQAQQNIHDPGGREAAKYHGEWAADPINAPVTSKEWLQQEAGRIHEAAGLAVPAEEVALAAAYWNGRRDAFNSAREDVLTKFPDRASDLPEAIQVDQIIVRQQQEQTQSIDRSISTAR